MYLANFLTTNHTGIFTDDTINAVCICGIC